MRLTAWLLVVILIFYGIYNGAMALRSYMTMSTVVNQVLQEPGPTDADKVRGSLLQKAADAGVPLTDASVVVSEQERVLSVRVIWSWPVFEWEGEELLGIPLSVARSVRRSAERPAEQPVVQPQPVVPPVAPPAQPAEPPARPSAAPR